MQELAKLLVMSSREKGKQTRKREKMNRREIERDEEEECDKYVSKLTKHTPLPKVSASVRKGASSPIIPIIFFA